MLPTELIREIFLYCEPPELVALCCTSRRFYSIGKAVLYRKVRIRSERQASAFIEYASEDNGPLVKSMSILFLQNYGGQTIDSALHSLKNLQSLQIYTQTTIMQDAFWTFIFPHLRSLSLGQIDHLSPVAISFLNRHSQLTSLSIHHHQLHVHHFFSDADNYLPVILNKLVTFKGPHKLLGHILRHSTEIQLQSVTIDWPRYWVPTNYLDTLQVIHNSSTSKSLRTFLCKGVSMPTLLIKNIAKCLPDISSLVIYTTYGVPPSEAVFSLPLGDMRQFRCLTKLSLHGSLRLSSMEEALNGIADSCPSIATLSVVSMKQEKIEKWTRYKEKDRVSWKLAQQS